MHDLQLFDLDGTLTNPKKGITGCVQYALEGFGINEPDADKLTCFIGPPLLDSFKSFYRMSDSDAQKAVDRYRERFTVKGIYENELYPGIPEMLAGLKEDGKTLILATSKPIEYALRILEHFDIRKYFDETIGADMHGPLNEKTDIIRCAVQRLSSVNKDRMVMVGDREMDISGAKENGIISVGVRFGYAAENELENAGADYIVSTPEELTRLLLKI
ncbi:MAG: HAD hydrolase-like protein [Clostridia bacterium]|nr:HAD hydrolase-like protein [Clostridia bacterium]